MLGWEETGSCFCPIESFSKSLMPFILLNKEVVNCQHDRAMFKIDQMILLKKVCCELKRIAGKKAGSERVIKKKTS